VNNARGRLDSVDDVTCALVQTAGRISIRMRITSLQPVDTIETFNSYDGGWVTASEFSVRGARMFRASRRGVTALWTFA